jgi:hypothetical protein
MVYLIYSILFRVHDQQDGFPETLQFRTFRSILQNVTGEVLAGCCWRSADIISVKTEVISRFIGWLTVDFITG